MLFLAVILVLLRSALRLLVALRLLDVFLALRLLLRLSVLGSRLVLRLGPLRLRSSRLLHALVALRLGLLGPLLLLLLNARLLGALRVLLVLLRRCARLGCRLRAVLGPRLRGGDISAAIRVAPLLDRRLLRRVPRIAVA